MNDLRTLRSKIDQMSRSARQVAEFLAEHPRVEQVFYPGLPGTPEYDTARKYMWLVDSDDEAGGSVNRFSHLMGLTVKGGAAAARAFFDNLQMVWRATDLGRVKTVATIPAISTHQQQGEAGRDLADVAGNLVRLSVGAEHPDDIIADLNQALNKI